MLLYLRNDLLKSEGAKAGSDKPVSAASSKGEQRGGKYAARVQVGYDADGSPKYRYFKTQEEYAAYMQDAKSKGKHAEHGHKKGSGELEGKVKKEHEESTKKQRGGLLSVERPTPKTSKTEKSLRLFVRT